MTPPSAARTPPRAFAREGRNSLLRTALAQAAQAQPQRVQLDEAFGVALVVGAGVFLEGDVLHGVEGLGRLAADHRAVALLAFQPHRPAHVLLPLPTHPLPLLPL